MRRLPRIPARPARLLRARRAPTRHSRVTAAAGSRSGAATGPVTRRAADGSRRAKATHEPARGQPGAAAVRNARVLSARGGPRRRRPESTQRWKAWTRSSGQASSHSMDPGGLMSVSKLTGSPGPEHRLAQQSADAELAPHRFRCLITAALSQASGLRTHRTDRNRMGAAARVRPIPDGVQSKSACRWCAVL